jgi:flavin reductase (DIM6/NTAB) family NADH-FMN oxidoreductase RutF
MVHYDSSRIANLDKLFRANLINSCTGYKSANLLATKSKDGNTNVAIFNSVTHIGSNPPMIGFILRPTTVPRNTYRNIKQTALFTVNHIHRNIINKAHQTSAKYDENISEFEKTRLEADIWIPSLLPTLNSLLLKWDAAILMNT